MSMDNYIVSISNAQSLIQDQFLDAQIKLTTCNDLDEASFVSIVVKLQTQDLVNQRLQHIIDGLGGPYQLFNDQAFKNSFLDLLYFQLVTIEWDLDNTITCVRSLAGDNASSLGSPSGRPRLFPRHNDVCGALRASMQIMMQDTSGRILYGPTPFTTSQATDCFRLYTMRSERIVLEWYLTAMPFGKIDDLLRTYEKELNNENQSIEFF